MVSILIHVEKGKITKIENEDLSSACSGSKEIPDFITTENFSFVDKDNRVNSCPVECSSGDNDTGKCDLKLFINWIGTDKNGTSLISASERLLSFENYKIDELFKSILSTNID